MFGNKVKKQLSLFLMMALLLSGCGDINIIAPDADKDKNVATAAESDNNSAGSDFETPTPSPAPDAANPEDNYKVSFKADNKWDGGFQGTITITNTGKKTLKNWKLTFDYPVGFAQYWNGTVSHKGDKYTISGVDWNSDIKVGESAEVGFIGESNYKKFPTEYQFTYDDNTNDPEETPTATATPVPDQNDDQQASSDPDSDTEDSGTADSSDQAENEVVVSGSVKKHGRLKIKGTKIVDKNGKTFLIKGPSTHGIAWFPKYVNKSCFKSFKKWGANTIRLACYSSTGEGYNTGSVWKLIDKGVKAATDLGMYVIIDWHILNENNPKMTLKAAKKFFKHFAKKYGKRKNVLFEICNEPHGCEWKTDIKPYAKKIIKLIRKYSKKNIIIVGTPTWSQDVDVVAQSPLSKKYNKNVCYTLHFYAGTHKQELRNKVKTALKKKLPILCTEFSICDASGNGALNKSEGKKWIKFLKSKRIGFIAWNISNKAESSSFIKSSCNKTGKLSKSNLTPCGKWVIKRWK